MRWASSSPKVIEALRGKRVVAIATGGWHSMVLTDEGTMLSFGLGRDGRLGHGDEVGQLEPKVIDALRGVRVVAIAAGLEHSMVLTDDGKVLSFGSNASETLLQLQSGVLGRDGPGRTPALILGLRVATASTTMW